MKNLITHPQFGSIRMKTKKGEPWFCAKDICEVLEIQNTSQALNTLDKDEKLLYKIYIAGQNREMLFVNESGLYTLIMRSHKSEARKFRKWVTGEVLPTIRKYGFYSTDSKAINRAELRLERQKVLEMLSQVSQYITPTDVRLVAKQCRCNEWQVQKVLAGEVKDPYMLGLLYARSTGNKILSQQFYTAKGAEQLLKELKEK